MPGRWKSGGRQCRLNARRELEPDLLCPQGYELWLRMRRVARVAQVDASMQDAAEQARARLERHLRECFDAAELRIDWAPRELAWLRFWRWLVRTGRVDPVGEAEGSHGERVVGVH